MLKIPLNNFQTGSDSLIGLKIDDGVTALDLADYANKIFEEVGTAVAKSSEQARELNFKPRERRPTYENLKKAGIRYVNKRPTKGGKKK